MVFRDDECEVMDGLTHLFDPDPNMTLRTSSHASTEVTAHMIGLSASGLATEKVSVLQRSVATTKDFTRVVPKPLVVVVHING